MSSNLVTYANENNSNNEMVLLLGTNKAYINGNEQVIDHNDHNIKPILKNDRTLVPVRFISESFGANVGWDGETKTVSITYDNKEIQFIIGLKIIKVNGIITPLDVAPEIINNRTFLPLRAISESIDKEVFYDNGLIVISDQEITYDENDVNQLITKFSENKSEINEVLVLLVGSNQTFINGNKQTIDSNNSNIKPIIKNNRTLVPVRYIAQSFGANVEWDQKTKTVSVTQGDKNIELKIDDFEMNVNGHITRLDVAPEIIDNRTYLPLRAISEALEKKVFYDNGLIVISSNTINYNDNHISYLKEELTGQHKTSPQNVINETLDKVILVEALKDGTVESFGSGFFIADGLVMTSFHVIDGYDQIRVTDILGTEYIVDGIYNHNISQDFVALKLNKKQSVSSLKFADIEAAEIGDKVYALGNPEGLNWSVTQGIVSAFRDDIFMNSYFIQTDAAVSNGSSGGPLINEQGEVIGIITKGMEYEDFNFAVIPYGINEIIENYNNVGYENAKLVPESDFTLTLKDIQNVNTMINNNIKGLLNNDKNLYFSTFHPDSNFLELEREQFEESVKFLEGYNYKINDIQSSKYGDTIMSVGYITLTNQEAEDHIVISRLMLDEASNQYKYMAILIIKDNTTQSEEYFRD